MSVRSIYCTGIITTLKLLSLNFSYVFMLCSLRRYCNFTWKIFYIHFSLNGRMVQTYFSSKSARALNNKKEGLEKFV